MPYFIEHLFYFLQKYLNLLDYNLLNISIAQTHLYFDYFIIFIVYLSTIKLKTSSNTNNVGFYISLLLYSYFEHLLNIKNLKNISLCFNQSPYKYL